MNEQLFATKPSESKALMEDSLGWIIANKDAWRRIEAMARKDAHEMGYTRMKAYIEIMRYEPDVRHFHSGYVKICNSYSSYFNRILVAWNPELAPFVRMRGGSKPDGLVVPQRDSIL